MDVVLTIGDKVYNTDNVTFENSDRATYFQVIVRNVRDFSKLQAGTPYELKIDNEVVAAGNLSVFTKSVMQNDIVYRIFI